MKRFMKKWGLVILNTVWLLALLALGTMYWTTDGGDCACSWMFGASFGLGFAILLQNINDTNGEIQ